MQVQIKLLLLLIAIMAQTGLQLKNTKKKCQGDKQIFDRSSFLFFHKCLPYHLVRV